MSSEAEDRLDALDIDIRAGQAPYLLETIVKRRYNPDYGDDRVCRCGHTYYRHFDTWEEDCPPVGCKYCECYVFVERGTGSIAEIDEEVC